MGERVLQDCAVSYSRNVCSIHTSTPWDAEQLHPVSDGGDNGDDDVIKTDKNGSESESSAHSSDSEPVKPARKRLKVATTSRAGQTQTRLGGHDGQLSRTDGGLGQGKGKRLSAGAPRATLVVAPMTLLSQWCDELERSSKDGMSVLMYYGNKRTNVQEEIDDGVQVVVTR